MTNKNHTPHVISIVSLALFIVLGLASASKPGGGGQTASQSQTSGSGGQAAAQSKPSGGGHSSSTTVDELDIAIRDASDYLNENIPRGSKIVILNIQSNSSDLSDYIIDELIANAVNDRVFTVVDRQQLDAIRAEQNFQLSGEVDDTEALAIGKFLGAQTIVSGAVNRLGAGYRIRIRALEVQTAQVQGQYNRNIASSPTITALMASGGSTTGATTAAGGGTAPTAPANTPSEPARAEPPIAGTIVPGATLAEKLAWLTRSADSHNTYILEVSANENIAPHTFKYSGAINITIVLRGDSTNRTIRLQSNGTMFTVRSNVTFILDNNITLQGHNGNNGAMVMVEGGTLRMRAGSAITGNNDISNYGGGGVSVRYGTFEMSGGTISGNTAGRGGGVDVNTGTLTISGGTISGNTASVGGGVYMADNGNTTSNMRGGTITGNTASEGGGMYVGRNYTFNMSGGSIIGNTASSSGGGVYLHAIAIFNKTGGTITGYNSDQSNGNVVRGDAGDTLARKGHAIYVQDGRRRKETTAGPGVNLSSSWTNASGAWDS